MSILLAIAGIVIVAWAAYQLGKMDGYVKGRRDSNKDHTS